ncbi:hypothetical protein JQM64_09935, partial [Fournierella massiliensis]
TALQGETFYGGLRDQGIELLGDLQSNLSALGKGMVYLVSRGEIGEDLTGWQEALGSGSVSVTFRAKEE